MSQVWYYMNGGWKNLAGRSLVSDSDDGRNISRVAGVKSAPYLTPHLVALISVLRVEPSIVATAMALCSRLRMAGLKFSSGLCSGIGNSALP